MRRGCEGLRATENASPVLAHLTLGASSADVESFASRSERDSFIEGVQDLALRPAAGPQQRRAELKRVRGAHRVNAL